MKNWLLGLCLLAGAGTLDAQSTNAILARMDAAAPQFHGVSANLQMLTYTAVLDDKTVEGGTLQMQRLKANDVRAVIDFTGQDARKLGFFGKKVSVYSPKLSQVDEYDFGKNSNLLNQFLLLGFGSSGKELAESYNITLEGTEKVAGADAAKLLLIPKDPKVLERITKIEVWIPNDEAYPVQQQFYEPSGNYRKVTYSNIKINPVVPGTLELKLPPGTKKVSH